MKKSFFVLVAACMLALTSCKKDKMPSLIDQMDNQSFNVESIKADGIEISQYIIANSISNAGVPTQFEVNVTGAQKSRMYKTNDAWQIETANLKELSNGLLNIQFKDPNPTNIGYQSNTPMTQELLDKQIITYQQWSGGGPYQPYYICNAEVLNGDYQIKKVGNEFTLTRIDEPIMVIKLTKK